MKKETFQKKQAHDMNTKGYSLRTLNGVLVFNMGLTDESSDKAENQAIKNVKVEYGDIIYSTNDYNDDVDFKVEPIHRDVIITIPTTSSIFSELYVKLADAGLSKGGAGNWIETEFKNGNIILTNNFKYDFKYTDLNVSENTLCDENIKLNVESYIDFELDSLMELLFCNKTYNGNKYTKELILKMLNQQPDDDGYVTLLVDDIAEDVIFDWMRVQPKRFNLEYQLSTLN